MKILHALAIATTVFGYCGNGEEAPSVASPPAQVAEPVTVAAAKTDNTVFVFTDFQCPYCKKHDDALRAMALRKPNTRIVIRHHPLPMHDNARIAAKAAIAAENQNKADAYEHLLFEHQDDLTKPALERYAAQVGMDLARMRADMADPATEARIVADEKMATELGVRGTPTSVVGTKVVEGARPIDEIESHLP